VTLDFAESIYEHNQSTDVLIDVVADIDLVSLAGICDCVKRQETVGCLPIPQSQFYQEHQNKCLWLSLRVQRG
jgi:hypothetical protein